MAKDGLARACAALVAAVGWFGLGAQLYVSIGIWAARGEGALPAVWAYLGYFTVLTNIIVALTMTGFALGGRWRPSNAVMTRASASNASTTSG